MILPNLVLSLVLLARPIQATTPVQGIPADYLAWHGWGYLQGATGKLTTPYSVPAPWPPAQPAVKDDKAPVWHLKVVIFSRTESDDRDSSGVLREHRGSIESVQLAEIKDQLERFKTYEAAKFGGAVSLVADISVESEWMRDSGANAFGAQFANRYFEGRINGGTYEAEDKVFRGPFNSVIYVLPGSIGVPIEDSWVNGTPVAAVSALPLGPNGVSLAFESALQSAWMRQIDIRAKQQGFSGASFTAGQTASAATWSQACSLDELSPQNYASRKSSSLELGGTPDSPQSELSLLPQGTVTLAADTERGQVLEVKETTGFRAGGLVLPSRTDGMPLAKLDSTPSLSFFAKSVCKDPICVRLDSSNGKSAWVSLGRDPLLVAGMQGVTVGSVPFLADGKWRQVLVDARGLAKQAGMVDVTRLAIEPSPNAKIAGRLQPDAVDYSFDEVKFTSDAPTPFLGPVTADAASDDPEARALFAAQAKTASADLAGLLKDRTELVRLNATTAYIPLKDASVETSLISNSLDLDPSVASAALYALMAEGSETARAVVRRSVTVSLSDFAKMTAAKLLADTKDPKMAEVVSLLLANHSWQARVLAVNAMSEIPTRESEIMRLAFLELLDPAVKLAVTRHADPNMAEVTPKLLWSAVNETSDMVRAESDIKLIQSTTPATVVEGYKGVRDDSRYVRIVLLRYMQAHPSEAHRGALRLAIADKSPEVRADAIRAFAAQDQGASLDEIGNVLDDQNSDVQLALVELSKKKGLKLPQKTLDAMTASPDPTVSAAVKTLG